jgi:hypothetical protein
LGVPPNIVWEYCPDKSSNILAVSSLFVQTEQAFLQDRVAPVPHSDTTDRAAWIYVLLVRAHWKKL